MALQGSHDMIFLRFVCRFVQREKVLLNVAIVHRMEKKSENYISKYFQGDRNQDNDTLIALSEYRIH